MSAIPQAWLDLPATHGNVVEWRSGHCWCCERDDVQVTARGTCANEFACAEAWARLPKRARRRA